MTHTSQPSLDEMLFEVLRKEPADRHAFLDLLCRQDGELRRELDALIKAHEDAADFLDRPAVPTASTLLAVAEGPGTVIDRYKLLQLIGEGGFGVVYMAEQREPVKRRVALKIIKVGMDTKQVIARFEAERQALAMMDHPNIAKVLDAGATEMGRPYFVMELVKGVPLTEFCDSENLTTRERLDIFMDVCNAVQHAHQKGIIHRDLKPGNVLVTMHDDRPVPKVIDFGIAKATNRELTDKTLFTEFKQFIGTPEYMSPEQAQMSGLDVDTRSDIYALGVLLYELLTGTTPFDGRELRAAGMNELQRIIREEEPPKPSTRLSTLGEDVAGVAKHRRDDPAHLARSLQGDLDWIVMKALEKNRTRRYETANGFAADIQRHLNHEPVIASPPSVRYRFKKLVQRNKGAFAAAGIVAAALVLGLGVATTGLISAVAAQRSEESHRLLAEAAQEEAETQRNQAITQSNIATEQAARTRANSILVAASSMEDPLLQSLLLKELAGEPDMPRRLRVARNIANMPIPMAVIEGKAFTLSPDGRLIATVSEGVTRVWQTDGSGEPIVIPGIRPSFSGDGRHVVTKEQGRARISRTDGAGQPLVLRHEHDVVMAEFSPDGEHVVTIERDGTARLWRANATEEPMPLGEHDHEVTALAFSADGARVAIASNEVIRVWPTDRVATPLVLLGPAGRINAVAFSPDGTEVAAHGQKDMRPFWPEDGELHDTVSVWRADGSGKPHVYARVGSNGGTTQLWQMDGEGNPIALAGYLVSLGLRRAPYGHDLAASEDGTLVIDGYWQAGAQLHAVTGHRRDRPRIWAGAEPLLLSAENDRVGAAAFNLDSTIVATGHHNGTVRTWSIAGARSEPRIISDHHDVVASAVFSPDGSLVATASHDGTARIRRVDGGGDVVVLHHDGEVVSVNFSPDGTRLVTAQRDGDARIWRVDGQGHPIVLPHDSPLADADFSPDGTRVVTGSADGIARIWRADGVGEPIVLGSRSEGQRTPLTSVIFSPDGTQVLTGGPGSKAYLWRADGTESPIELEGYEIVLHGDFSPDGARIVMGCTDGEVRFWNADGTGEPVERREHLRHTFAAEFSPDGTHVVTASQDGTAHVWWVDGSQETLVLRGHDAAVLCAAFSPDGTRVITASADGTARIWRITWPGLLDYLQANVSTCLMPEERMWYLGELETEAWSRHAECEREHGRTPDPDDRPEVRPDEEGPSVHNDRTSSED